MILICILKIQANLKLGKQIANLIIISIVNQICFIGLPVCQKYQTKIASALGMYSVERVIPPTFQYNRKSNYFHKLQQLNVAQILLMNIFKKFD